MNQPCKHRGGRASCCQSIFECNEPRVTAKACTPTVKTFAAVVSGNPGIDAGAVGANLHVCAECLHYQATNNEPTKG